MANTSAQEKIEQLRRNLEYQANPNKNALSYEEYQKLNQPLYGQGSIRGETPAEKRKARWTRAGDAAKGALSSIYGAATFIPETLARIGTAGVDQIAGTDTQSKLDEIAGYVPNKLRNSASNSKMFDKGQEYTDDALMAAALLTAGASGPKSPTTVKRSIAQKKLNQLMKNPSAYSAEEAANIIRARYSLPNTATENALQTIGEGLNNVAQKIGNTKLFKAIDKAQAKKAARELGVTDFKTSEVGVGEGGLKVEDMPAYAQKRISNLYNEAHYNYKEPRKSPRKSSYAGVTNEGEIPNNGSYARYIPDEWLKMAEEKKVNNLWNAREMGRKALERTSRARANATKKRNMSAKERAARERAENSANELAADRLRNEAGNMSLDDMYRYWKSQQNG